jgi:hypothetical protein
VEKPEMRYALLCALAMVALLAAGCTSAESVATPGFNFSRMDRVAVVDVLGNFSDASREQIVDFVNMQLQGKRYGPVERTRIKTVLAEQAFEHSEHVTSEQAAQLGKILNVPAVVMVTMPEFGETMMITARLVDTQTGEVGWTGTAEGSTGRTAATIAGAAAGVGTGLVVAGRGSRSGKVAAGAIGGVLGGVAGYSLTSSEIKKLRGMIKAMFQGLPAR